MPNEPENPKPPSARGRPSNTRDESEQLVKVVSYIPKKLLPILDAMAAEDGRTRASMINRIIQAAITGTAVKTFQDIHEMRQSVKSCGDSAKNDFRFTKVGKKKKTKHIPKFGTPVISPHVKAAADYRRYVMNVAAVRKFAKRNGYRVFKSRDRSQHLNNKGQFQLADDRNTVVLGLNFAHLLKR